jgi:capsular exopolysaccharide synthesis family protein
MSRIQDILAKAERDGTARRTQPTGPSPYAPFPAAPAPPAATAFTPPAAPAIDGSSALDAEAFIKGEIAAPAARPEPVEARTAVATLHPLLVAALNPHSPVAEQYRTLRTRIAHRDDGSQLRTIIITSPDAGDGKSLTAGNLALAIAQEFQRRVVLIDANLRSPSIHSLFGVPATPGLTELAAGEASLDEVMVYLPEHRLTVIPAGAGSEFPTELLGSAGMRRVIDTLHARFDRILLDMPPVIPLADVRTVAPMTDGIVMVVRAGITQRPVLDQALSAVEGGKVVGVVLNDVGVY